MQSVSFNEKNTDTWNLSIRYEGGDAVGHEIDLSQLGQSLQGMARILAVSAHFARTEKYNKQLDALSVKVVAQPVNEHHCFEVSAAITNLAANKELWSGLGTAVFMGVIGYVFNRRKGEELKHLSDALKQSQGSNAEMQSRLLATIEKLADALQPAVRQALAPIGLSVESINIRQHGDASAPVGLDRMTKELASAEKSTTISDAKEFSGVISELDMMTGACKVSLETAPETRISSVITDPIGQRPGNPYAQAMAKLQTIRFTAKAEIDQDGDLINLYISDLI
jgi:hypothetical protein